MKIRLTARAGKQVRAADAWWREHRADGTGFLDELDHALGLLQLTPDLGALYVPRATEGVRRLLLSNSQYYVYYVHRAERRLVRILAVWSCHRGRAPQLDLLRR